MRRSRRGSHGGPEFGGSGEDSFVAVVVTKLTGALLFILLLTMVIMALLPKVVEVKADRPDDDAVPLAVATPESLPEAIAGRPYDLALAAVGGKGPLRWAVDGPLPDGLRLDPESGRLAGTPRRGTSRPLTLQVRVSDGRERAGRATTLVIYQPDRPLTVPSRWDPGLPPIPWSAWLEQGFGFLVLLLVHMVGMNAVGRLAPGPGEPAGRFRLYRGAIRLASLSAAAALALWLRRAGTI